MGIRMFEISDNMYGDRADGFVCESVSSDLTIRINLLASAARHPVTPQSVGERKM